MHYTFLTKARTLNFLQEKLSSATIAPLVFFTVADWQKDNNRCLRIVEDKLGLGPWIVRSSCKREDNRKTSNAGAFLSLLNVPRALLENSISEVIRSYGDECLADEVLIQPMLEAVTSSGVAFSHDPSTCAPYRVITWSEGSDTTIVTSGKGGKTWQQAALSPVPPTDHLAQVITLLEELMGIFGEQPVDCEFAFTYGENGHLLWLLQARPLLLNKETENNEKQQKRLKLIQKKVEIGMSSHPFLVGKTTAYGVMSDWNPAEIIGVRPKPLALSVYRELITDTIWAYQRHNYGYRNLRSFPLMPHFLGLPYIDLRLSFNSFIPADIEDKLAGRLVDYYINCLLDKPTLHDKVEFEIVFSCYTLDLMERIKLLEKAGFTKNECKTIAESLRRLTNCIIHPRDGLWNKDASKIEILQKRRDELMSSSANPLECIYWLLEDAKRYGTLPFAGLARAGFIAVQFLKSLVSVGIFSQDDYDAFIASVTTVGGQLLHDRATLDKSKFLLRYGHLRPGTYDILSPRYDEKPELYFDWDQKPPQPKPTKPFSLTSSQMRELEKLLNTCGLYPDPVCLVNFLKAGIELREKAKFYFTRNLSDALVLISEYGRQLGFALEDLAFCNISIFKELHIAAMNPKDTFTHSIEHGKACYKETSAVSLPPLIVKPEDIWGFEWPDAEPNFITQKQITAPVVALSTEAPYQEEAGLTGKGCDKTAPYMKEKKIILNDKKNDKKSHSISGSVICIPNADPGFDWLFSYPIAGLITTWGGPNSHMAIRAGELGLPAVIGAGENLYRRWSNAKRVHLNCAGRHVEVLT